MNRFLTFITIMIWSSRLLYSQIPDSKDSLSLFKFRCYNDTISIYLPMDYKGPKYFCHDEGCIVDFFGQDMSIVSILCAGCTILNIDRLYLPADTIHIENGDYYVNYYCKSKDKYACICHINRRTYMYSEATLRRKRQLDRALELIENK